VPVDFNLQGPPTLGQEFTKEVEEAVPTEAFVEFLRYHQKYGHISPLRIQAMARRGILPRRLATYPVPVCTACLYGKAHKKPWRSKPSDEEREAVKIVTKPGECVSVDMMTSPTPGLVAQMSGKPTCKRYKHAAVYVDQATGLGFTWLQKSVDIEDTMEGKLAFEQFCQSHGILVQHYHANNGIFASNTWRLSCQQQSHGLPLQG